MRLLYPLAVLTLSAVCSGAIAQAEELEEIVTSEGRTQGVPVSGRPRYMLGESVKAPTAVGKEEEPAGRADLPGTVRELDFSWRALTKSGPASGANPRPKKSADLGETP
jgi:hypothetical protein